MAFRNQRNIIVASAAIMALGHAMRTAHAEIEASGIGEALDKIRDDMTDVKYTEPRPQVLHHPKHKTHPKRVGKRNR